ISAVVELYEKLLRLQRQGKGLHIEF
ncbi:hypothetical protein HKBW3S06_01440, partial [Candidatus Hakubella thermalkaliphila]